MDFNGVAQFGAQSSDPFEACAMAESSIMEYHQPHGGNS